MSYAHADKSRVYPELKRLHEQGYNFWYDEGIPPSTDWPETIGTAIARSSYFVVFFSKAAISNEHAKKEIYFACDKRKNIIPIYLEETTLTDGLELQLGPKQAILKHRISEQDFLKLNFDS
ncbi:MAG: hypothetical protein RBG13Loki_1786 [Promethearchaeota archaeon CR_4]|nr:MAG: hypothetical protein RBG13Loki_1786 [Candidatus Lokiarchaeota archaeon CR_4]